jgi:hypothetical protein
LQEAASLLDPKLWPLIIDTDDLVKQKKNQALPKKTNATQSQSLCYLDFSISTTGSLTAVKVGLMIRDESASFETLAFVD